MATLDHGAPKASRYDALVRIVTSILFIVMIAVTSSGIFARYVLNNSLVWADTIALWLFVWLTFFGAATAVRRGSHMAMDVVREILPARLRLADRLMGEMVVLTISIFLMLSGYQLVQTSGGAVSPATGLSNAWAMTAIPVGSGLMAVEALRRLVREIRTARAARATPESSGGLDDSPPAGPGRHGL